MEELGLFPLGIVLLPSEHVPLHIFEPRYRELIAECLDEQQEFGVIYADGDGVREVGTRARVIDVLEEFADGRLNVVVEGGARFRVERLTRGRSFLTAIVAPAPDGYGRTDPDTAARAVGSFRALAAVAGAEPDEVDETASQLSFELAAQVELPSDVKQELLELDEEQYRLEFVIRLLDSVREALLAELAYGEQRLADGVQQPDHELEPILLFVELEQLLLHVGRKLHLGGELEGKLRRRLVDLVRLGAGHRCERAEGADRTRGCVRIGPAVAVGRRCDDRGEERTASREPLDTEACATFDDDVQPAVGELLEHVDHPGARADVAHPVTVRVDHSELLLFVETLGDQLPVPRLEDVQGHVLARQQHDPQREQAKLLHRSKGTSRIVAQRSASEIDPKSPCTASSVAPSHRCGPAAKKRTAFGPAMPPLPHEI